MMINRIRTNQVNWTNLSAYITNLKTLTKESINYYIILFQHMLIGTVAALIIERFLWWKDTGVTHSVLELTCIVFNMSLFFIVWNKYDVSPTSSRLIAFGLLSTTIFDAIHIYCFEPLGLSPTDTANLAVKFWILGRLTEVTIIFASSLDLKLQGIKLGKKTGLLISLLAPVMIAYLSIKYNEIFPILYNDRGLTINKLMLELIIIILAMLSLFRHKNKIKERGYISYKYLSLSIMVMIPTEICLMLYKTYVSSIVVYGHVFRIIYCYFLHKSVFQGSIDYTYQKIENLHVQTYTILNCMASAALICDNQYNILSVNKSFEELTGVLNEKLIGMNIVELDRMLNYHKNQSELTQTVSSIDEQYEISFTNIHGINKEIIVHKSNILNIYNESIGKIITATDITELKEKQQKLLHNEKLALLGQMGATIVHETRNFLTTIKGCSQLIESMAQQDNLIHYAKKINTSTDEVNRIISDFLSLSKPKTLIREEMAVCDLLDSMKNTIETSAFVKGINMEFINKADERYVLCDETQMKHIILNICKNAAEAMEDTESPKLIVESGIREDYNHIYIKISDNGKGMEKETLDKIGTLFFTTKQSGTGLGLSVCYDIIKQHGGWIDVDSEKGIGTTFTINIPGIEDEE